MIERTLVVVKPDGVERALVGRIISKFEDAGLKVIAIKMVHPSKALGDLHYIPDKQWMESVGNKTIASFKEKGVQPKETAMQIGKRVHGYLTSYLTQGPVVAMVIEGNEAIGIVRKIIGATEPRKADPSSIRGMYSTDSYDVADKKQRAIKNLVHASEDKATSEREIGVWFKPGELMKYKRVDESSLF